MTINLKGYAYDSVGVAKSATVELWEVGAGAAASSTTTDVDGMWQFTAQDGSKDWRVKIIDGLKVQWIAGLSKIQLHEVSGVIIDNGSIDMLTHQIIGITNLVGNAAANSLNIQSNVTGGAAAQRDVYVKTGNASNPQILGNRMLFKSNAADGAVGIVSYEPMLWNQGTAMTIINDSGAGNPASAQIYSTAPGVFDLATGAGNNVTAVKRLSISNAATSVATWSSITHSAFKVTGASQPLGGVVLATGAGHTADDIITALQTLGLVTQA